MTTDVMLKLIEAGYTKEDIDRMEEAQPAPADPAPMPEDPAPDPEPADPAPAEPERMTETINEIMQIITKMQNTLDAMQKKNVKEAEGGLPEKMTADQVIKDFFGERKKA